MRTFLVTDVLTELPEPPTALPERGFLWISGGRREFEVALPQVQATLHQLCAGQLLDLHVSDLLNSQLPSQFDYTSAYDLLVFRRLAAGAGSQQLFVDEEHGTMASAQAALGAIDTSPVGFAVFERVLLTVHPADCMVRDFFVTRLANMSPTGAVDVRGAQSRMPPSPDDLMLRIVNHMVDGYLDLRRLLTRQLGYLQKELLRPNSRNTNWQALLDSRNALHHLEDLCEDQHSAVQEWIDALAEWPAPKTDQSHRERELLRVRSRDIAEHIERVLGHIRRLEHAVEGAVQIHFSAVGQRTNEIMRTLTVLTAIFLPLNLITGFFGMNFDFLPLIHSSTGFWLAFAMMFAVGIALVWFFWRKRYLSTHR
jgi:magnesium transporter